MGENEVGVADEVSFIGIDDLVLVAVSPGKVLGDTGFYVSSGESGEVPVE